jgi:hypothetical protein
LKPFKKAMKKNIIVTFRKRNLKNGPKSYLQAPFAQKAK